MSAFQKTKDKARQTKDKAQKALTPDPKYKTMEEKEIFTAVGQGKTFKWMTFIFAIFLVISGSMLVYESSQSSIYDTTQNVGLITVGSIVIVMSAILLLTLVYVEKQYPQISMKFCYAVVVMIMFGTTVGTISIINGVDVPNENVRATLGWTFGGVTCGVGVIGIMWSLFAIVVMYGVDNDSRFEYFARWAMVDVKARKSNLPANESLADEQAPELLADKEAREYVEEIERKRIMGRISRSNDGLE